MLFTKIGKVVRGSACRLQRSFLSSCIIKHVAWKGDTDLEFRNEAGWEKCV